MRTKYADGVLTVTNRFDYTNFSECELVHTIEADGNTVAEKQLKLRLAPHETAELPISVPAQGCRYGLYLTCKLYHSGELVAQTQHMLGDGEIPADERSTAAAEEKPYEVIFSGEGFRYEFSKQFGTFTSLVIAGEEQLAEPVRLTAWRAPTDNDRNIKLFWGSYNIWQGENLDKLFSKVYDCQVSEGCVRVAGSLSGVSRKPFFRYTLEISVDGGGRISVSLHGNVRENVVYLPRLGFELTLPEKDLPFRYYGCGPLESYRDQRHGSTVGMYESSAEREYVPYVRPQEHGNHVDVKLLEIGKMRFESKTAFECNVSAYSVDALDRAEHTDELVSDGRTHLRIDYKVSGIGSNSCGPELMKKYRFEEKQIAFGFIISPKKSSELSD